MNVFRKLLLITVSVLLISACGGADDIKLTAEMEDFLSIIQGSYEDVSEAVERYAADDHLKTHTITMYDLYNGKVIEKNENCYTVEFNSGLTVRIYEICWEERQISNIISHGMK